MHTQIVQIHTETQYRCTHVHSGLHTHVICVQQWPGHRKPVLIELTVQGGECTIDMIIPCPPGGT